MRAKSPRVLIIVENLPVPFDRRVWLECQALTSAGYRVAVVCPKGPNDPAYEEYQGVELYKYRARGGKGGSGLSFAGEYVYSFVATLLLALRASHKGRFDVVQTCNPPDIFWPIGILFRVWHGAKFVFDHHDLCPELFRSRFPKGSPLLLRALTWLERATVRSADHVISTNESYRATVVTRHGEPARRVTVVRTGPDPEALKPKAPVPFLKGDRTYLAAYIGVMGPQDGVDVVLRVADEVVHRHGRTDIGFLLMGAGDCFEELVALRDRLGLRPFVEFTGRVPDATVADVLSTADVGLSPDPKNPLNDVSTMNKTMEYMCFGLPVVAFDLRETRVSAGEAAVYATPNRIDAYAGELLALLDDEPRRATMGAFGRSRIETELAWRHQVRHYLGVYRTVLGGEMVDLRTPAPVDDDADADAVAAV